MDLHGWVGFGSGFLLLTPRLGCFQGYALTTFVNRVLLSGALPLLSSLTFQIRSFVTSSFCSSISSRGSYLSQSLNVGRDVQQRQCPRMRIKEAEGRQSDRSVPISMDKCVCVCLCLTAPPFFHRNSCVLELGINTTLTGREGDCVAPQLYLDRPFLFLLNVTAIDIEPVREEPANRESRWRIIRFPQRKVSCKECLHPFL